MYHCVIVNYDTVTTMISIQHLTFSYGRSTQVLKDAIWESSGGIIGLLGKNGTGKSTFLYLLQGLLKPKSGSIRVLGQEPFQRNASFLADVFLLPERYALVPGMTLDSYVKMMAPFYPAFDYEAMEALYIQTGLNKAMKFGQLSMGTQKLFMIAFALSTRCKVLLLDEPSNGLDIPNKQLFRKLLLKYSGPEQLILIATHQVKDIEDVVEHLLIIHDGHFILDMDLLQLSEVLTFGFSTTLPEGAFYHERYGGGYHFIAASSVAASVQTAVNIELLFNACIHNQLPFLTQKIENHG